MKIALIQPPSPFLIDERVFPNISITRVATKLQNDGHDVSVFDFSGKKNKFIKTLIGNIANHYDYFGFSSTTPQFPYVMDIFRYLKIINPNAKTILGGAHASALYRLKEKGIKDKNVDDVECFDIIFAGEAEGDVDIFQKGWHRGEITKDIDTFAIPNRDFLDIRSYKYKFNDKFTTTIQTQRGCPHQCVFCCGRDIQMYNTVRTHSPERVIEELDMLHKKYKYDSFMWYDDEININIDRLKKLCKLLSTRKYQHRGFIRSDMIVKYPESVQWMKDAGFTKLCAGIESGSDRILTLINKKNTYKINKKACELVKAAGIHFESFLLLGHPSETMKDIGLTKQWLLDAKPDDFDLNIISTFPGSKIYNEAIPSTKYKGYEWEYKGCYFNKPLYSLEDSYYKGLQGQSKSDIRTDEIDNKTLIKLRDDIEKEVREKLK